MPLLSVASTSCLECLSQAHSESLNETVGKLQPKGMEGPHLVTPLGKGEITRFGSKMDSQGSQRATVEKTKREPGEVTIRPFLLVLEEFHPEGILRSTGRLSLLLSHQPQFSSTVFTVSSLCKVTFLPKPDVPSLEAGVQRGGA